MKLSNMITICLVVLMISCKSKTVNKPTPIDNSITSTTQTVEKEVVKAIPFFIASGKDNSWSASVSAETITIKTGENTEEIIFPYHAPLRANEAKLRVFRSTSGTNAIEITVTDQPCSANIENEHERYEIFVKLTQDGIVTELSGCGVFAADKALNTVWTLQQLNGKMMTPENFGQELPYIDIHTEIGSFTGFGGCNRVKGSVGLFEPGTIRFSNVIETKMICVDGNQEGNFMRALQSATSYQIKSNMLFLYKETAVILIFKK